MRLFVLWERPAGWSRDDTHAWAQRQLWPLRQSGAVRSAQLVRLASAGASHPLWHEWLLELHVANDEIAEIAERDPALLEFIGELRSLAMKPVVLREADGELEEGR